MLRLVRKKSVLAGIFFLLASEIVMVRVAVADAAKGGDVFDEECAECHSLKAGKNKKGPSLFGITGRQAGTIADYNYSDAMKAGGFTWTTDKMDAYITDPKATVPGGKMKYKGLKDASERANVIEFLATQK